MIYNNEYTLKAKLGNIIQFKRNEAAMSQKALAKVLIYDQSVISRIEKGYEDINIDLYIKVLNFYQTEMVINKALELEITRITEMIFTSYEFLNINDFNVYLININNLIRRNRNIIKAYDLFCLKMVCLYMLRNKQARTYLNNLKKLYIICEPKCKILYHMIEIQYYLYDRKRKDINIELKFNSNDYDHGLIQYLWGKYYFETYSYSKAIEFLSRALISFKKENNVQRIVRCEIMKNEIFLRENQFHIVRIKSIALLKIKGIIINNDKFTILFHLGYCLYNLHEYQKALAIFTSLIDKDFSEHDFILHLTNKCLVKLKKIQSNDIVEYHILDRLYFKYGETLNINDEYCELVEKLMYDIESNFYKKEYRYYLINLLNYYFNNKKYSKFLQLSHKIDKITHIF